MDERKSRATTLRGRAQRKPHNHGCTIAREPRSTRQRETVTRLKRTRSSLGCASTNELKGVALGSFHSVDVHVGTRLRQRRTLLAMSQSNLGEAVGLTFQQVQKYERGANRMGASRLYEFAKVLDVPVSYFFDEMPSNALSGRPMSGRGRKGYGEAGTPFEQEKDPLIKRETLELVRAYYKIREGSVRKRIFGMVKAVGAASHAKVLGGRKRR
jgi:transcriptional regulator with XRE-family HTH domain